ncbi:hypothetical protein [Streptomyces rochei]
MRSSTTDGSARVLPSHCIRWNTRVSGPEVEESRTVVSIWTR